MPRSIAIRTTIALALVAATFALFTTLPVGETLRRFVAWVRTQGAWGPLILAASYTPACILFVPGTMLSLGAGFAFGAATGIWTVSLGSTLGATAAFAVGRTLLRAWITQRLAGRPKFRALDAAVAAQGLKLVVLTRLSPVIPFNFLNYTFGASRVRLRDFILGSWIGMAPATVVYVSLGAALADLTGASVAEVSQEPAPRILFLVGLGVTIVVTAYTTRLARRALAEALAAEEAAALRE